MLGTANNEACAWALYKKAAAHGDAAGALMPWAREEVRK